MTKFQEKLQEKLEQQKTDYAPKEKIKIEFAIDGNPLDGAKSVRENNRLHLKRLFPYLHKEYRTIEKSELNKIETLKELFGDGETDFQKLKVIFLYQTVI